MSKSWLDDTVKILELISIPIILIITIYGVVRDYLTDFWKGFVLGALLVFLLMLVVNVYFYWKGKDKGITSRSGLLKDDSHPPPQIYSQKKLSDRLFPILRRFTISWEHYMKSGQSRWLPPTLDNMQSTARVLSRELIGMMADYADLIEPALKNEIDLLVNYLNQYGSYKIWTIGSSDVENMDTIGKKAYETAKGILSSFDKPNKPNGS